MTRGAVLLFAVMLTPPIGVADAQPEPVVVAAPLSSVFGFATPVTVASAALGLEFVNLDTTVHNVAAVEHGPDSNPWCARYGYQQGSCPLFRSDDIGNGATSEVFGVDALVQGQTYDFVCTYHGAMKGSLVALPA